MQCPRCGSENAPGARACSRCGLLLAPAGPPASGPPSAAPRPGAPSGPPGSTPPGSGPPGSGPPGSSPSAPPPPAAPRPGAPGAPPPSPPTQQQPARPTTPYSTTQRLAADAVRNDKSAQSQGIVTVTVIVALIAAVVGLGYAGFALTMRRGIYADIDDDPGSVSKDDAESSDNINAVGLWAAGLLIGVALVLILIAMVSARRGRNGLGIVGVVLVLLGAAAATWGSLLVNGVDEVAEAGDAVTGYLVVGPAFAAMALGLILGILGVRRPAPPVSNRPASSAPFPSGPYGGQQQSPYGQQPTSPYAGGQSYGGQSGTNPYAR